MESLRYSSEETPLLPRLANEEPYMDVAFENLALKVGDQDVLRGVTGAFSHCRLAGIMGPSGSGTYGMRACTGEEKKRSR